MLSSKVAFAANSPIGATQMIQVIQKQANGWQMIIHGYRCYFSVRLDLFVFGLLPQKPNADNGLRWRINGKWVSYRQIKNALKDFSTGSTLAHAPSTITKL